MNILESADTLSRYIREQRMLKQRELGKKSWKDRSAYTYDIDGRQITTNYDASEYTYWDGNGGGRYRSVGFRDTIENVVYSLVKAGYTNIRIKYTTTRVRGWHNFYVFYK